MEKTLSITGKIISKSLFIFFCLFTKEKTHCGKVVWNFIIDIHYIIESSFYAEPAAGFYTLNDNWQFNNIDICKIMKIHI